MRILVLTSSYPTSVEPVASAFLQDWVNALVARAHDVTVLAPTDRLHPAYVDRSARKVVSYFQYSPWPWLQTLAYGGGMYDNVCRNPFRLVQLPGFLHALYRQAVRLASRADVMHAHWLFPAGMVAAAVNREVGTPLVISVHSTDYHLLRSIPGGRALARAIIGRADQLHFVTEYHRRRFAAWLGPDSINSISYVAPMGIPDSLAERPSRSFESEPTIGFMGRLIPMKGVDRLLHACARLGRRQVSVAGSGPQQMGLVRLALDLQLDVRFVGPVRGAAKARFLDSCDIMVFPSRHYKSGRSEGLPVSLLEALARGRVVVASDSGGIPEIVRDGENGYLFPAESRHTLGDRLQAVLGAWPRASSVGRSAMLTGRRFTASALAAQHEATYRTILSSTARQEEPA